MTEKHKQCPQKSSWHRRYFTITDFSAQKREVMRI